jgi:hypothetical protein
MYCSQLDSLVGQEVGRLLARSGLAEVVERVRLYQVGQDNIVSVFMMFWNQV